MKKTVSIILSALMLIGAFVPVCLSADIKTNDTLGVWWWNITDIIGEKTDTYLDFCVAQGVTEIYLNAEGMKASASVDEPRYFENIRSFIARCNTLGIRVSCLCGSTDYFRTESTLTNMMNKYNNYQAAAAENEKFYGIHFDVEPQQDAEFKESDEGKAVAVQLYADFLTRLCDMKAGGFADNIELDIPVWFEEKWTVNFCGETGVPLLAAIARTCEGMILMDYRTKASSAWNSAAKEMEYAALYGCRVVFGFETSNSGEGSSVDFSSLGYAAYNEFYAAFRTDYLEPAVQQGALSTGYGCAVHQLKAWNGLYLDWFAEQETETETVTEPETTTEAVTEPETTTQPETEATTLPDDDSDSCSCLCHSNSQFGRFIWKIVNFFYKLFGINRYCDCGEAHWS